MIDKSFPPKWSLWLCALILGPTLLLSQPLSAQSTDRKIRQKVSPEYPDLARRYNASGLVRLSVEVSPAGEVRTIKVLGGHPLLVPAAEAAIKRWKYEPAKESTTEIVEFKFVPNQ